VPPAVLLDADVPPALAEALRGHGHDVVAASGNPALEALSDAGLLAEALRQERVLVTFNVVDFVAITHDLAHTNRSHAGVILIHARTLRRSDIKGLARSLNAVLRSRRTSRDTVLLLAGRQAPEPSR
jgi:predicted nuclease of predicted toxin-antitoxin system